MADDQDDRLDKGLYIHRRRANWPSGTRTMTLTIDGEAKEWVHADDFMAMQKERDDLRRALGFINAWRWSPNFAMRNFTALDQQLQAMGFTRELGLATLAIIRQVLALSDAGTSEN